MLNSNEPIKVVHFQKLANQTILNGALVVEMLNMGYEMWAVKNVFPLDFAKYLSYSEVQKNRKAINVSIRFQQVGNLF